MKYWVWLSQIPGLGPIRKKKLLEKYKTPEKIYMVKGLNDNIDKIISYKKIPTFVETAIIQFKDEIVYDGMLSSYPINFGISFVKTVDKDYNKLMKYYHL